MESVPGPSDAGSLQPAEPRVGAVSQFVGGRLLMIGLITAVLGLGLMGFAGFKLWLVVTGGSISSDVVPMAVSGFLAFSLLSIGGSAWRNGHKYLSGERAVSKDMT